MIKIYKRMPMMKNLFQRVFSIMIKVNVLRAKLLKCTLCTVQ